MTDLEEICECDGSGRIVDRIPPSDHSTPIGDGLSIQSMGGYSSRLCSCRKKLPKRDGKASWWGASESVFEKTVEFAMFDEWATLSVGVETCINEDNYLVHRTPENMYYPCIAHLELSEQNLTWLLAEDMRKLAAMLLDAADKCDEVDNYERCPRCHMPLTVGTVMSGDPDDQLERVCEHCGWDTYERCEHGILLGEWCVKCPGGGI